MLMAAACFVALLEVNVRSDPRRDVFSFSNRRAMESSLKVDRRLQMINQKKLVNKIQCLY